MEARIEELEYLESELRGRINELDAKVNRLESLVDELRRERA